MTARARVDRRRRASHLVDLDPRRLTVPLWPDAATALSVGRSKAYALARSGEWPTRLLRLGDRYRVPVADLRRLLGLDDDAGARPPT